MLAFDQDCVTTITNMTEHRLTGRGKHGTGSHLLDRRVRLWLARTPSMALDANAQFVATNAGTILIEDSDGGLWFRTAKLTKEFLVRLDPSGKEASMEVQSLDSNLCEAPDKTFWFAAGGRITRIRHHGDSLEMIETQSRDSILPARPWFDRQARLWHAGMPPGMGPYRLDCFITSLKP